ncbi:MAG: DNA polymerase III subunit delta' [Candidatus Binatia bacterium]|nr:DNA polymerase III subunit delta' [Candidatus Binatia bacterium]
MPFAAIQGQERAIALLQRALARDRLAHAYLFIGPSGIGKKRTAYALAQAVLCNVQPRTGCGTCTACALVAAGVHPDVILLAREPGKQGLGIDQVRDLQRLLGLRPVQGEKKIALLDDAHLLHPPAQSALLKLLEEPPGDALLILLTVNSATLSRPLVSRCQQVRFRPLPLPLVEALLVREHGKDPATARTLALYSQGSLGRALSLDPKVFIEERRYLEEELQQLAGASFATLSRFAEWLVADRVKKPTKTNEIPENRTAGDRLELVLSWYEEVLRCALLGQEAVRRHTDRIPAIVRTASELGAMGALQRLTIVYDTLQALQRNANRQLAVEDMLLQLAQREPGSGRKSGSLPVPLSSP